MSFSCAEQVCVGKCHHTQLGACSTIIIIKRKVVGVNIQCRPLTLQQNKVIDKPLVVQQEGGNGADKEGGVTPTETYDIH